MGKLAELLLDALIRAGGKATLEQIAGHTGSTKHQVEICFTNLNYYEVVDFSTIEPEKESSIQLAPNWQRALMEAARRTGALDAIARLKARFAKERAKRRKKYWQKATRQGLVLPEVVVLPMQERGTDAVALGP